MQKEHQETIAPTSFFSSPTLFERRAMAPTATLSPTSPPISTSLPPPNNPKKPKYHQPDVGIQHYRNLTSLNEDTFYKIQQTYLEMISFTDWTFGQLLDGLKTSGLESKTAVFHSSDHG